MTRLFKDYLDRSSGVLRFYSGDWGEEGSWEAAARRAKDHDGPREETAGVLRASNEAWLTGEASARLRAVAEGRGTAVVGGQQAGLLGGPLYTLHKALTLLSLADAAESLTGGPVLPVFWVASNDSDLEEAGRTAMVGPDHRLQTFRIHSTPPMEPYRGWPVGRIPLGETADLLLKWTRRHLPETEFREDLLETIASAYRAEATVAGAFFHFMGSWLGPLGLVLLDPLDPRFKPLAYPLYRQVLEDPGCAGRSLQQTGGELKEAGYHRQLHMPSDRIPLFATGEGDLRRPLVPIDGSDTEVEVAGVGPVGVSELLDPDAPWSLDPNAALRPVLQDHLLPTAGFAAGPAEIAYFGQLGPLYEDLEVPRPLAVPRDRVVLVPRTAARVLEKYSLAVIDFEEGPEHAARKVARDLFPEDLERAFERTEEAILGRMESLKQRVINFDETLEAPFDTSAGRMAGELRRLREKAISNQSREEEIVRQQTERAAVWLYPDRRPQERVLNPLPFAVRHGMEGLLEILTEPSFELRDRGIRILEL
ncbi:MAG: bacillithiol biosynthesis cysteine-adding enzyme BshC [bacterium]